MKKLLAYSLLATFVAYGCQVKEVIENTQESQPEAKVFTAVIEDNTSGDTKTSLDGEGNVLWKQGDQVSIFAGSTVNEQYQVSDASDGKTAATLNKVGGGGFVAGTEIDNNVAFYPYASTAEIAKSGSNYVISEIELPATQNYAAGSFGNGAFPMAAVTSSTEDMNLKFKNVLGGLKLQLKGTATITSITVTGNNNEILCGDAEVTTSYGSVPSIALSDASAKTVTLDCGAGVALNTVTATPFIIALPPITMTGGFTVLVTDSEGKQMEISTSKSQTIPRSSLLRMPVVNYVGTVDYSTEPFTITSTGETSVSIAQVGSPSTISLQYKKDSGDWTAYTIGSVIDLSDSELLQFKQVGISNKNKFSTAGSNYYKVVVDGSGTISVSGNIMSLLDGSLETLTFSSNYIFNSLFRGCTKLVNATNLILPVTSLTQSCYGYMFYGCSSLTAAPTLPATTLVLSCYEAMFNECSSLTTAPALPATTLAQSCYRSMFGDSGLISAPNLPATTMAYGCYEDMFFRCSDLTTAPVISAETLASYCFKEMFYQCTSLETAPALPATTLASNCYDSMFRGCTSLETAPALPAASLANYCYASMFMGCSSLTTAPVLPATSLASHCYDYMFYNCSNLNYIKALFTTSPGYSYTDHWVDGVAATGTFVKSSSALWSTVGYLGVPSGWTVETE